MNQVYHMNVHGLEERTIKGIVSDSILDETCTDVRKYLNSNSLSCNMIFNLIMKGILHVDNLTLTPSNIFISKNACLSYLFSFARSSH